jgi:serine/threonine protein kinase
MPISVKRRKKPRREDLLLIFFLLSTVSLTVSPTYSQALTKQHDRLGFVALKVYKMDKLGELQRYQVYREIRIHSQVQHPNLIRLLLAFQVLKKQTTP